MFGGLDMSASSILSIAQAEVGYLEKKSNAYLDDKTKNAGSNNYNKYARDIWPELQAQPWCDLFVSWCAYKAGESAAVGRYAYVPSHVQFFKNKGQYFVRGAKTPQAGDIIFFKNESHVGLVEKVAGGYVTTLEGNTSGGSTLIANGGGVCRKTYPLSSSYIQGYGRPAYKNGDGTVKQLKVFNTWQKYKNGSTSEPVYKNTDRTTKTGSLDPYEECYCLGVYGDSYLVVYKLDGTSDDWACGYVAYAGGIE